VQFLLDLFQFVLGELEFGFGFQTHLGDVDFVVIVLQVDVLNLIDGVQFDLSDTLLVVHLDLFDFSQALVNFVPLKVHLGSMLALTSLDSLFVLAALHIHFFMEIFLVLILLCLE